MSTLASPLASTIVCGGCRAVIAADEPYPFRCPNAGDGGDHVLRRVLDEHTVRFPSPDGEPNPFVSFRTMLHAGHLARGLGMPDEWFADLVRELDAAVAGVEGHGFVATPFGPQPTLARATRLELPVLVKDETGNVAGSHKARHLFGLLVHLEVVERLGLAAPVPQRPLAIASCGNAALAAAVVAAAGRRRLVVFVPPDADRSVLDRLRALGAGVTVVERPPGVPGDPTYHRLRAAIGEGALPFTCQGNENGLAIEGGETLGYEIARDLVTTGMSLDHIVVQVGGGALASAVAAALGEAHALGVLSQLPRFHTVQTESAWPLKRAYDRVVARLGEDRRPEAVRGVLQEAARHRSEFMWPWESEPHSIAHGILDDETYDWLAVVEAMLATGGQSVVVGEEQLADANRLARDTTGIDVDPTGSAGVAGLAELRRHGVIGRQDRVAVLFSGVRR